MTKINIFASVFLNIFVGSRVREKSYKLFLIQDSILFPCLKITCTQYRSVTIRTDFFFFCYRFFVVGRVFIATNIFACRSVSAENSVSQRPFGRNLLLLRNFFFYIHTRT